MDPGAPEEIHLNLFRHEPEETDPVVTQPQPGCQRGESGKVVATARDQEPTVNPPSLQLCHGADREIHPLVSLEPPHVERGRDGVTPYSRIGSVGVEIDPIGGRP